MGRKVKIGELFLKISFHQKEVKLHKPNYVFLSKACSGCSAWCG